MRLQRKTFWRFGLVCLVVIIVIGSLASSKPVRIRYHKWRLAVAKQEHLRLGRGEYRFSDKVRELLLGGTLTWAEVETKWKRHEDALVELGYLLRVEYFARRGKVPPKSNPEFAAAIQKMDAACPLWSYRVSKSETSLTVTGTKHCLELWKKLAPSAGLQEEQPTAEDRRCSGKRGNRLRSRQPSDIPAIEWTSLFGHPVNRVDNF